MEEERVRRIRTIKRSPKIKYIKKIFPPGYNVQNFMIESVSHRFLIQEYFIRFHKYFIKMGKGRDASDTNAMITLGCSALTFIMGMLNFDLLYPR